MRKKGELAIEILKAIGLGAIIMACFVAPNLPKALIPFFKPLRKKFKTSDAGLTKSLIFLKKQKLVDFKEKDNEVILTLTEKGKKKILKNNLENMKIPEPNHWDGYWRLVIFDIPDKYKQARTALREKFNDLGFYPLQKSCYIYPFECKNEIDFITEIFEVTTYINYLVVKKLDGSESLKKFFKL